MRLGTCLTLVSMMVSLLHGASARADDLGDDTSWGDVASDGESLVFGRFVGKFESIEFRSRNVRIRNMKSGKESSLAIDDALGYIAIDAQQVPAAGRFFKQFDPG